MSSLLVLFGVLIYSIFSFSGPEFVSLLLVCQYRHLLAVHFSGVVFGIFVFVFGILWMICLYVFVCVFSFLLCRCCLIGASFLVLLLKIVVRWCRYLGIIIYWLCFV